MRLILALPLLALVIPWGYAWKTYVLGARAGAVLAEFDKREAGSAV